MIFLLCGPFCLQESSAENYENLTKQANERLERVTEFKAIRTMADDLGVRVWLFGGTAAAYLHYVKWDLRREAGDDRYHKSRFDYDFTNMFRSTQDLDIVVDGGAEEVKELQRLLKEKFPYFIGSKDQWEVRSLTEEVNGKMALLDNPDFLNQHTDSNSVGMMEITNSNEPAIRDLFHWNDRHPPFLEDIVSDRVSYYYSNEHESTKRFKEGKNPPIFSVIRTFIKAFQFDLDIATGDLKVMQEIINDFNPESVKNGDSYISYWLEKNGPKLIRHAVNVEYAWNLLEKTGLRQKIIAASNPDQIDSVGWWLNREPLRSFEVGQGDGKTIAEIARERNIPIDEFIVAHETNNYFAWESITRDTTGRPNVLISRGGAPGEMAAFGDGFYTKMGRKGARNTGLTIRYLVDPKAREGKDFILHNDYLIINNRSILRTIPETINFGPVEYFQNLAEGKLFHSSDKGIQEKLKRRIDKRLHNMSQKTVQEIVEIIEKEFSKRTPNFDLIERWFDLDVARNYPHLVDHAYKALAPGAFVEKILSKKGSSSHREYIEKIFESGEADEELAKHFFNKRHAKAYSGILERLIERGGVNVKLCMYTFSTDIWSDRPDLIHRLIDQNSSLIDKRIPVDILNKPYWSKYPDLVDRMIPRRPFSMLEYVLSEPFWKLKPRWVNALYALRKDNKNIIKSLIRFALGKSNEYRPLVKELIEGQEHDKLIVQHVLTKKAYFGDFELAQMIIDNESANAADALVKRVFSQPEWSKTDFVKNFLEKDLFKLSMKSPLTRKIKKTLSAIKFAKDVFTKYNTIFEEDKMNFFNSEILRIYAIQYILGKADHGELDHIVERLVDNDNYLYALVSKVLGHKRFTKSPEILEKVLDSKIHRVREAFLKEILYQPHWAHRSDWMDRFIDEPKYHSTIALIIAHQKQWQQTPRFMEIILETNEVDFYSLIIESNNRGYWIKYPQLVEKLMDRADSYGGVIARQVLSLQEISMNPSYIEKILETPRFASDVVKSVLSQRRWTEYPHLIDLALRSEKGATSVANDLLIKEYWANKHPQIFLKTLKAFEEHGLPLERMRFLINRPYWRENKLIKEAIRPANSSTYSLDDLEAYLEKSDCENLLQ